MPKIKGMPDPPGSDFRFEVRKSVDGSVLLHLTERSDSGDWYSKEYIEVCKSIYDLDESKIIEKGHRLNLVYENKKRVALQLAKANALIGVIE